MFFNSKTFRQTVVFSIACFLLFVAMSCYRASDNSTTPFKLKNTSYDGISQKMILNKPQSEWAVPADMKSEDLFLIELKSSIHVGMDKYSEISEVKKLKEYYGQDLSIGVLDRNPDKSRYLDNYSTGKIVALAYPKAARVEKGVLTLIGYYPKANGGGVISMPGFRSPDIVWFNARFLHELYHQHQHDTGQPGALAYSKTDVWVLEEVKAHEFAGKVLNAGTKGKYFDVINQIINQGEYHSVVEMLNATKLEDVQRMDNLFAPAKVEEMNNRLPQYYLDLSFSWLKLKHEGQNLEKNQITVYRSLH